MKYAVVFCLFALVCAIYVFTAPHITLQVLAGSFAVAFGGVGLAYAFIGERAFLKRADGRLHPLSYVLYAPYHAMNWLSLRGFRRAGKENAFDRIAPNVYLGCRLNESDRTEVDRLNFQSVLDLTCEFGATPALRGLNYRCIPLLDTRAPTPEQLRDGAQWIKQHAATGPVYVHCALGHGRSATFVAAYLLFSGQARTADEAIEHIKAIRPRIGLHPEQRAILESLQSG